MSIFQKICNGIKNWTAPAWMKIILSDLNDMITALLLQVGKSYIESLRAKIVEVSYMSDLNNKEKFDLVFKYAKTLSVSIKDSTINMIIEMLVNSLKKTRTI